MVVHLLNILNLLYFYLLLRKPLVGFCKIELLPAVQAEEVLATRSPVVPPVFNVLLPAHAALEGRMLVLLRVQSKMPGAEELVARHTLQRTHLAALGTESRSHWSEGGFSHTRKRDFLPIFPFDISYFLASVTTGRKKKALTVPGRAASY